jgi:iron complex transport system substrate-binding protein
MHLMTRRAAVALAALLLALTFAACGDEEESTSSTTSTTEETESSASAFPVTVEHRYGSTTIEKAPERVVTIGYTDQDITLALGVVPVGVGDFLGGYDWRARPWAQEALGGAEPEVVGGQEINYEAVAAQRPDLIFAINAGLQKADYEKLSKIAPTVGQSGDYIDFGMPWDEQTLLVGKALGKEQEAEQVVADVEAKFEQVRTDHPEFAGKTAVLAYGGPDGYGAYATEDTRSRFLTDLGFKIPEKIDELAGDSFFVQFSQEQFRLMDQDVVVMYGAQDDILANPVFKRLDAVKEDRVIYLDLTDQFAGALGFSSALSTPWMLDETPEQFAAAVDGDPATAITQPE